MFLGDETKIAPNSPYVKEDWKLVSDFPWITYKELEELVDNQDNNPIKAHWFSCLVFRKNRWRDVDIPMR